MGVLRTLLALAIALFLLVERESQFICAFQYKNIGNDNYLEAFPEINFADGAEYGYGDMWGASNYVITVVTDPSYGDVGNDGGRYRVKVSTVSATTQILKQGGLHRALMFYDIRDPQDKDEPLDPGAVSMNPVNTDGKCHAQKAVVIMSDEEKQAMQTLEVLDSSLSALEHCFAPFLKGKSEGLEDMCAGLTALEGAKLHSNVAYSLGSLFFIYLRLLGVEPKSHPVSKELTRVKTYLDKISAAAKKQEEQKESTKKRNRSDAADEASSSTKNMSEKMEDTYANKRVKL